MSYSRALAEQDGRGHGGTFSGWLLRVPADHPDRMRLLARWRRDLPPSAAEPVYSTDPDGAHVWHATA